MYEYKVLTLSIKESEKVLNRYAGEGWRLVTVSPNVAIGMGIIATMERKLEE